MTHALTRSPHAQLTSASSAASLSSFSVPAVMPLSSSSALPVLPLKAPQPPLFLDASHFTSLMKEHQSNIAQQQRSMMQQQPAAMPLRPLPHPLPSAASSPGSSPSAAEQTSASPSAASLTLTSSLPLSWSSQRGSDSFTGSFPPPLFSSLSLQRGGPGAAQQLFAASPSPPPAAAAAAAQQLQALASSSAAASSASVNSGQSGPQTEQTAGSELSYAPLASPSPFYPASPPGSLQSFSSLYPQPPSPALPSVSPFPVHSSYFPSDLYAAQSQQAYMQMVKGLVTAQSGSVMALDAAAAAGGKRKAEAQQYMGGSAATAAAAAAVAAAAAAAAGGPSGGRHSACAVCHSAKTSCNGQRPCDRCIRLDRQSLCVDRPRKQPTRSDKKKDSSSVSSKKLKVEHAADEQRADDHKPAKQSSKDKKIKEQEEKEGGVSSSSSSTTTTNNGSGSKELNGAAAAPVKMEAASSSGGSRSAPAAPSSALSPAVDLQRLVSNHSTSSSSSSSAASTPSSPASAALPAHDDNTIDVSTVSVASSLPAERRLSSTYLRMHQLHHTRTAIADAIKQGLATPAQVHFLLSYLGAVLHPDDFMQLLRPSHSSSSSSPSSAANSAAAAAAAAAMPGELISASGVYAPRYVFNFACSPLEPIPDCSVLGMDFATLQIMKAEPSAALAAMNWEHDDATTAAPAAPAAAAAAAEAGEDESRTMTRAPAASEKAANGAARDGATEEAGTGGAVAVESESNGKSHQAASHPVSFASSTSAFSAFSPTSASAASASGSPLRGQASSAASSTPSSPASASSASSGSSSSSSSSSSPCEIFLIVRVNREFERLFGFSQASMRDLFRSEGGKVLYTLLTPQSMGVLSRWLTEALTGGRSEMKAIVTIVNKWRGRTDCLLNTRWTLDGSGIFRAVSYVFSPLPDKGKA